MWSHKGRLHALLFTGLLGTLLCGARPSSADTYTVLNTNDSGAGSLRAAVAAANGHAGADTVDFAPGVTGVIALTTGEISSEEALTVSGPGAAVLELNGSNASRIFTASANLTLTGLTFRNGKSPNFGAGAVNVVVGSLQASDCVFASNTTVSGSGGAAAANSGAILTNCTFTGNTGGSTGGTSGGALHVNSGGATLTNCTFTNNRIGGAGGGVNIKGALVMTGCTFTGNIANGGSIGLGGGVAVASGSVTATNCSFNGNSSAIAGGALRTISSPITLTNCTFTDNSTGGSGTSGGALEVSSGGATLTNCTFTSNRTGGAGGGVDATGALVMTGCAFTGNVANGGSVGLGGGVAVASGSVTATNCSFNGNSSAIAGGALRTISSPITLTNCTFTGNSTGSQGGGAVQVSDPATLANCTITGNSSSFAGGLRLADGPNVINNCIIWGNTASFAPQLFASTAPTVSHSDIQGGGFPAMGNIDQDPLFVRNPFTLGATDYGDLRLQAGSPCRNTGSSALLPADGVDLDGDMDLVEPLPRDLDNHPRVDGSEVDMGAYEAGSITLTAPATGTTRQPLTVQWTAPAGQSATDWIGFYRASDPGPSGYLAWTWTSGAPNGSFTVIPPSPGTYVFRYYLNNGSTLAAVSQTVTVTDQAAEQFQVTINPASVAAGETITISWNIPANRPETDWIGLFPTGTPGPSGYVAWFYVGGPRTGSKTLPAPTTPGTYEARYYLQDSGRIATVSNTLTVTGPTFTVTPGVSNVATGGTLTVSWTAPAGRPAHDWVALVRADQVQAGSPPVITGYVKWAYTGGATSGSTQFSLAGVAPGTYYCAYLLNDTLTVGALSTAVTVTP